MTDTAVLNSQDRIFEAYASVEVVDHDGEIVDIEDLIPSMDVWMDRGAPIMLNHSNVPIGKGLTYNIVTTQQGKKAVLLKAKIHDDYETDKVAWQQLKDRARKGEIGLSIGARPTQKRTWNEQKKAYELRGLQLYEVSLVGQPANPEALILSANYVAKEKREEIPEVLKAELMKPFAGYENFASCVKENGSKSNPEAYCAAIMRQVEGKSRKSEIALTEKTLEGTKKMPEPDITPPAPAEAPAQGGGIQADLSEIKSLLMKLVESQNKAYGPTPKDEAPPKAPMEDGMKSDKVASLVKEMEALRAELNQVKKGQGIDSAVTPRAPMAEVVAKETRKINGINPLDIANGTVKYSAQEAARSSRADAFARQVEAYEKFKGRPIA